MAATTNPRVKRMKVEKKRFLTLMSLESDPGNESTDVAFLATKTIRAIKRSGQYNSKNLKNLRKKVEAE